LKKQIGIIIDRKGNVVATIVGDEKEILIPVLDDYPLGRRHLRGIRCVHTHLKNESLSQDDLAYLALLRLDIIAAIGVKEDGLPGNIYVAHLLPFNPEGKTYEIQPPVSFYNFNLNIEEFLDALEDEMGRAIVRDIRDHRERAILVSVSTKSKYDQIESLEELKNLAISSNVVVLDAIYQRPNKIHPKYLLGIGKMKELIIKSLQKGATLLIFDQELTPTQVREIGEITELKVIDRTQLILDIFARRAHSRGGKVQVELAQLKYLLPKLTGKGKSLSRLMGGIGGRGPGETKLEVDRRRVQARINHLEKELENLTRSRLERRKRRVESGIPIISIVGYTNAGKSTLLNTLTKSTTLVEDKLFATLDTATKRLRFPRERNAVITDTVGFIKNMPEDLKKAFKATLEETQDADLLIHLVDISNPQFEKHINIVERLLDEIELFDKQRILVFNKIDLVDPVVVKNLSVKYSAIPISAKVPETLYKLLKVLEDSLWPEESEKKEVISKVEL
jgi:GTP-binding protein HflX